MRLTILTSDGVLLGSVTWAEPVGVGAVRPRWILAGEQSSLLTQIAATESVSLCARMKSRLRFSNLKRRFGPPVRKIKSGPRDLKVSARAASER
jgi:hypothetical protein